MAGCHCRLCIGQNEVSELRAAQIGRGHGVNLDLRQASHS
jgi:hypothetical protein